MAPSRGRKKPTGEPVVEVTGVTSTDTSTVATTSPLKPAEKAVTTPVKVEVCEVKKADSEFRITSPEINKEIKIELEDVKKMEKDDKKKRGKKEDAVEKMDKEDKEKKVEKGKGKGKKKKESEEKEVKEESDVEKRVDKKIETDKKKAKKKVKKKSEESPEKSNNETNESIAAVENKVKQDDTKLEKIEKVQKPDDSKVDVTSGGESDSITKPLPNVSSPKQPLPVASSQEPKEVPVHSPRLTRDVHKPEENENIPIPETSTQHHHQPSNIHLPNVPSHGVFDPMALLAHVSSTAQAAATNTVFQNTPPDTPERSPHVLSHGGLSPEQDSSSMRSEGDAGMESETLADHHGHHLPQGGESPTTCDTSTLSNGSSAGSSGNLPSSESGTEAAPASSTAKRKSTAVEEEEDEDEETDLKTAKKKKRGHKRQSHGTAGQSEKSKGSSKSDQHHSSKFYNHTHVNYVYTHSCSIGCIIGTNAA